MNLLVIVIISYLIGINLTITIAVAVADDYDAIKWGALAVCAIFWPGALIGVLLLVILKRK